MKGKVDKLSHGNQELEPVDCWIDTEIQQYITEGTSSSNIKPINWKRKADEGAASHLERKEDLYKAITKVCFRWISSELYTTPPSPPSTLVATLGTVTDVEKDAIEKEIKNKIEIKLDWVWRKESGSSKTVSVPSRTHPDAPQRKRLRKLDGPGLNHRNNGQFKKNSEKNIQENEIPDVLDTPSQSIPDFYLTPQNFYSE